MPKVSLNVDAIPPLPVVQKLLQRAGSQRLKIVIFDLQGHINEIDHHLQTCPHDHNHLGLWQNRAELLARQIQCAELIAVYEHSEGELDN